MKRIGIIKRIDKLGRLQIPKEIRKRLNFENEVELIITDAGLLIRNTVSHKTEPAREEGHI